MATKNEPKKDQEQKKSAPAGGEKVSKTFKKTIKAYLDKRAAEDVLFAKTYAKENKNLDECCNYILQQVKKSGCCGFADEEIYSMAIHWQRKLPEVYPQQSLRHAQIQIIQN